MDNGAKQMNAAQKTEIANEIRSDIRAVVNSYRNDRAKGCGAMYRNATRNYVANCIEDLRALRAY